MRDLDVEQFVFSSTMLVHAPSSPGRPITEDSPLEPKWDYPRSKIDTEQLIHAGRGDTPAVLLRQCCCGSRVCTTMPATEVHGPPGVEEPVELCENIIVQPAEIEQMQGSGSAPGLRPDLLSVTEAALREHYW